MKVFNGMSLGDLQAFITEQEKLSIRGEPESDDSPVVREFRGHIIDSLSGKQSQEAGKNMARWHTLWDKIFTLFSLQCLLLHV